MLLFAAGAWAGGFTLVDSGVRAQGRAGAFVAGADDISAQMYNPAALANVQGTAIKLDLWAAQQTSTFDREDRLGTNPFDPVESAAPPVLEPAGGVVGHLGRLHPALRNTTVAFGVMVPTGADYAWPAAGAQRYALISSQIRQVLVGPSVAQQVAPWLVVGASVQYTRLQVNESLVATLCNAEEPDACGSDNPMDDVRLDLDALDAATFTWNAGALLRPARGILVGASVQPGIRFEASGSATSTLNEANTTVLPFLTGAAFSDPDATVIVDLPWTARLGVQVTPHERARIEVAGTWTGWSTTESLRVTDLDLQLTTPESGPLQGESIVIDDDMELSTGFVDSGSLRFGGEWDAAPFLTVRAGVYGESGATPDSTANASVVDADKAGGALGATVRLGPHLVVDVSGMFTAFADREVSNSGYAQPALHVDYHDSFATTLGTGRIVGDGRTTSSAWVAGLGVGWAFGARDGG